MDANQTTKYIEAYYKTNQSHVAWSFWASLVALAIGLAVLITGVGLALAGSDTALSITTVAAGVLTQFISAGFFFLYTKNLGQLNVFYQKLVQNHDLMFAFGLTGHIPEDKRPDIIQGIIGALLSRSAPSTELTADLVRALNESKHSAARS
jgi:O-antigen/teichoic acid export membrane protein